MKKANEKDLSETKSCFEQLQEKNIKCRHGQSFSPIA